MRYQNGLQLARFLAAASVVFSHIGLTYQMIKTEQNLFDVKTNLGEFAVELFSGISGYVMAYLQAKGEDARLFALARAVRIIPLYWLATTAWQAYVFATGHDFELSWNLASMFFVSQPTSGKLPILYVGWSLEYEMFFYILVFLTILCIRATLLRIYISVLAIIVLSICFISSGTVLIFFAVGQVSFLIWSSGQRQKVTGRGFGWLLIPLYLGIVLFLDRMTNESPIFDQLLRFIMVLAILGFAVSQSFISVLILKAAGMGDSSYTIYLLHPFFLVLLGKFVSEWKGDVQLLNLSGFLTFIFAASACVFIHRYLELPVIKVAKRWLGLNLYGWRRCTCHGRSADSRLNSILSCRRLDLPFQNSMRVGTMR